MPMTDAAVAAIQIANAVSAAAVKTTSATDEIIPKITSESGSAKIVTRAIVDKSLVFHGGYNILVTTSW